MSILKYKCTFCQTPWTEQLPPKQNTPCFICGKTNCWQEERIEVKYQIRLDGDSSSAFYSENELKLLYNRGECWDNTLVRKAIEGDSWSSLSTKFSWARLGKKKPWKPLPRPKNPQTTPQPAPSPTPKPQPQEDGCWTKIVGVIFWIIIFALIRECSGKNKRAQIGVTPYPAIVQHESNCNAQYLHNENPILKQEYGYALDEPRHYQNSLDVRRYRGKWMVQLARHFATTCRRASLYS